jgi:hypothetical protein
VQISITAAAGIIGGGGDANAMRTHNDWTAAKQDRQNKQTNGYHAARRMPIPRDGAGDDEDYDAHCGRLSTSALSARLASREDATGRHGSRLFGGHRRL